MNLKTFAILVGIDAYKHEPLTASVNDAMKIQAALFKAGIVAPSNCILMTAPLVPGSDLPTRSALSKQLLKARENSAQFERLIFFFSGHGEMTFSDADQSRPRTVILPTDYEGEPHQRPLCIDVEELLDLFRLTGPGEQIFIFDCCRKQATVRRKSAGGGALLWPETTTSAERAQAAIYGVALKGEARAQPNQLGLMTEHIIAALDEHGMAFDYLIDHDLFGLTAETLTDYVRNEVRSQLTNSRFIAEYDLPTIVPRGPRTSPLLSKRPEQVGDRTLTITINPPEAVPVADVSLVSSGTSIHKWPPNGVPFAAKPVRYGIRSALKEPSAEFLPPDPPFEIIDLRRTSERIVEFRRIGARPSPTHLFTPAHVDERQAVLDAFELRHAGARAEMQLGKAFVVARAHDRFTYVEIVGRQPPFISSSGFVETARTFETYDPNGPSFVAVVEPGLYEVRFKLGTEIYSRAEVEAVRGRSVLVQATAGASPLIIDTMLDRFAHGSEFSTSGEISESVGELQGGVAATFLPALAIRPFDIENQLLKHFPVDLRIAPEEWPAQPLSIIVGVDGPLGGRDPHWDALFKGCSLEVRAVKVRGGGERHSLQRLGAGEEPGLYRLARVILSAPSSSYRVTLHSSLLPFPITVFASSLPRRVTALSIRIVPDKSFEVSLNLFQYPHNSALDEAGNRITVPFPKRLRLLQIAQRLFSSRQLYGHNEFLDLLWFKWLDPIVGVMALLELLRRPVETSGPSRESMYEAAHNLKRYFRELPDVHVVAALVCPACRSELTYEYDRSVPILAECVRHLAIFQEEDEGSLLSNARLASRLQLGQPWTVITSAGDLP
jgi:hypothetical protein